MVGLASLSKQQISAAAVLPLCLAAALIGWAVARKKKTRSAPVPKFTAESSRGASSDQSPAGKLRKLLADSQQKGQILVMPCCYDGLTAKLIERSGFQLTFMTGFGVSAVHGFADCQLVSYQEMLESAFRICGRLATSNGFRVLQKVFVEAIQDVDLCHFMLTVGSVGSTLLPQGVQLIGVIMGVVPAAPLKRLP